MKAFEIMSLFSVLIFLAANTSGQNTSHTDTFTYSPKGSVFSIEVPGRMKPPQGGLFEGSRSVFRVIEPFKQAEIYNIESERNGKRSFLLSVAQLKLGREKTSSFLSDEQIENLTMLIGDEMWTTPAVRESIGNIRRTSWNYSRRRETLESNPNGQVYVFWKGEYLIILGIAYDWGIPTDSGMKEMLDSFSIHS